MTNPAVISFRRRRQGFTLVELMVSIALVLVLIIGVNQVFRIATTSVNAGQALSDNTRDNRSVQTVFYNDFQNSIIRSSDSPCFIIRCSRTSAFLDRKAEEAAQRYAGLYATFGADPTPNEVDQAIRALDLNDDGDELDPGDMISRNDLTRNRNFRQDIMCFFVRHLYPRQTGNDGVYVADMTSNEAWVWYGQVRQPADFASSATVNLNPGTGVTRTPGSGTPPAPKTESARTNPNNFYARQWALGRVAILLREPEVGTDGLLRIFDKAGVPQWYHTRRGNTVATSTAPLSAQATATTDGGNVESTPTELHYSRYDLASTTIDGFRRLLANTIIPAHDALPSQSNVPPWYGATNLTPRFAAYAFPTKPMSSYGAARTVPWLVGGCTQFIIEFAGDYLNQNESGSIIGNYTTATGTDGRVDFITDGTSTGAARRVRWYGFPRDMNGDRDSNGKPIITRNTNSPDVLPLRDSLGFAAPCEHFPNGRLGTGSDYVEPALDAEYVVAWQPNGTYPLNTATTDPDDRLPDPPRPSLIRITMTIDDPAGRLPSGQTYEYVIEVP